jgi:hypothetical protein
MFGLTKRRNRPMSRQPFGQSRRRHARRLSPDEISETRNIEATMQDLEQAIRERAYQLWTENGCPEGQADSHWLEAQRQVLRTSLSEPGRVTSANPAPAKSKKAKAARKSKRAA